MYTQLFGHYLLNKGIIDADELHAALTAMTRIKPKLGAVAIDAGYSRSKKSMKHNTQQICDSAL